MRLSTHLHHDNKRQRHDHIPHQPYKSCMSVDKYTIIFRTISSISSTSTRSFTHRSPQHRTSYFRTTVAATKSTSTDSMTSTCSSEVGIMPMYNTSDGTTI